MDLHVIPAADQAGTERFILYRPLAGLAFVGNRALAAVAQRIVDTAAAPEQLDGVDGAVVGFLDQIGFFQPDPPPPPPLPHSFQPTTAVLLMTNQCQLRCTYCYAAAGTFAPSQLTRAQAFAAIDYVCQRAQELQRTRFEVSFHGGGEPTFNWGILKACVAYARQKPLPASITLTSNGIWSSRQRAWIATNIDGISLSVDGRPDTQNRQRPFRHGRGSADIVWETIAYLDAHRVPYGIRMTATTPWEQFPQDVQHICSHTGCRNLQVEPAFNDGRGGHDGGSLADCQAFATAFIAAYEIAQQAGRQLHYAGARLGTVTRSFCTAPYQALIVNAQGEFVTCYEITGDGHPLERISRIGRLKEGQIMLDEAARSHLHGLISERQQTCGNCFCYWSCAGDCYTRTFQPEPKGHLPHGNRCEMNQAITRRLLLSRIADSGGVWRR